MASFHFFIFICMASTAADFCSAHRIDETAICVLRLAQYKPGVAFVDPQR
jgi:hypothetical protein